MTSLRGDVPATRHDGRAPVSGPRVATAPNPGRRTLVALVAHATSVPAAQRAALALNWRNAMPAGAVLVETCHRTELYAADDAMPETLHGRGRGGERDTTGQLDLPAGTRILEGTAVADHLVGLAVGLRSTVIAEDQILHQLRTSVEAARERGRLAPQLDRLFDLSLRAGRRARSWLPAQRRPSLADIGLEVATGGASIVGREVLVVGAGEMGRLAATAVLGHRGRPIIASRTPARTAALARELGAATTDFDPPPDVARRVAGVFIALRGPWMPSAAFAGGLAHSGNWVVDLSSPPALLPALAERVGGRIVTIDDLARIDEPDREHRLVQRLGTLASQTVVEFEAWLESEPRREAARAMAEQAELARTIELDRLWERLPALGPAEREEIEQMARHLAERLLREPLERLGRDADGHHARAARDLFGL